MLTVNYTYRIDPDATGQAELLEWMETCRGVYNYALRELKDWIASRKCSVDRCSLEEEYIIRADEPFPSYHRQQNNLPKAKKQFPHLGRVLKTGRKHKSKWLECTVGLRTVVKISI